MRAGHMLSASRIYYFMITISFMALVLINTSCSSKLLPTPPEAQLGDVILKVTVKSEDKKNFRQGSKVIVTLADISENNDNPVSIAGDIIPMTQPDNEVRISFPADSHKVKECSKKKQCGFIVQVVHGNTIEFSHKRPVPYNSKHNKIITIKVKG